MPPKSMTRRPSIDAGVEECFVTGMNSAKIGGTIDYCAGIYEEGGTCRKRNSVEGERRTLGGEMARRIFVVDDDRVLPKRGHRVTPPTLVLAAREILRRGGSNPAPCCEAGSEMRPVSGMAYTVFATGLAGTRGLLSSPSGFKEMWAAFHESGGAISLEIAERETMRRGLPPVM
jgi:hypothetical protein